MTHEDRLRHLVRAAMPPVASDEPPRDLWPRIVPGRRPAGASRHERTATWVDVLLAAAALGALLLLPGSFGLLAYHL